MDELPTQAVEPLVIRPDLARRIQEELGQNVYLCYQCVKCTSGCPLGEFFDWQPNQVMRALPLEKGGLVPLRLDESALSTAYAPRRIALLVGISEFQDPQWRNLRYAAKDAEDLAAALRDPARGHFDQVRVLTRPEETTRASILAALRRLRQEATRPDDVVVVYFSAHGTLARDGQGELKRYLVTQDASYRAISQTALSMDVLKAVPGIAMVLFGEQDVIRHPLVGRIVRAYDQHRQAMADRDARPGSGRA